MTNELQVWKPSPFDGTDLLPVDLVGQEVDTTGRENIEASDYILPSIKLLQGMSEECNSEDNPEARPGRLYHTGLREVFEAPLRVLLCAHTKSRALFPRDDEPSHANLERCVSRDAVTGDVYGDCASCEYSQWGENRRPPACSESQNFTALTPWGPAIIRFARTSFMAAREFISTWAMSPKTLWAHPTQINVRSDTKNVRGKNVTFFKLELKWLVKETVPPSAQAAAKQVNSQISAAHGQGRFKSDDDTTDFDNVPL